MKKYTVISHITTSKEVVADTREEAIELAETMTPHSISEKTIVKKGDKK